MNKSDMMQAPVYSVRSLEFWVIAALMVLALVEVLSWNVHLNLQGWKQYTVVGILAGGCYSIVDAIVRCIAIPIRRSFNKGAAQ